MKYIARCSKCSAEHNGLLLFLFLFLQVCESCRENRRMAVLPQTLSASAYHWWSFSKLSQCHAWDGSHLTKWSIILLSISTSTVCKEQPRTEPAFLMSLLNLSLSAAVMLLPEQTTLWKRAESTTETQNVFRSGPCTPNNLDLAFLVAYYTTVTTLLPTCNVTCLPLSFWQFIYLLFSSAWIYTMSKEFVSLAAVTDPSTATLPFDKWIKGER